MFFSSDLRISDDDRDAAVEFIKHHYAAGRLSDSEFSDRVDAIHRSRHESQLVRLTRDLPAVPVTRQPERVHAGGPALRAAAVAALFVVVLMLVPADAWGPLLAMVLPLVIMLALTVGPVALPVIAFVWLARALSEPRHSQRALPPRRDSGRLGRWEPVDARRRW